MVSLVPAGPAVVLLSGGVRSSVVAAAAKKALGNRVVAVTVRSEITDDHDYGWAVKVAQGLDLEHRTVRVNMLSDPAIHVNGADRCYRCRRGALIATYGVVQGRLLEGGTAEDKHIPGVHALEEQQVLSPLRLCGLSNAESRLLAKNYGLPNADRLSRRCLATRFAERFPLDADRLQKVASLEAVLRNLDLPEARIHIGDLKVIVEIPHGCGHQLEHGHDGIMQAIREAGLPFSGYAFRHDSHE